MTVLANFLFTCISSSHIVATAITPRLFCALFGYWRSNGVVYSMSISTGP